MSTSNGSSASIDVYSIVTNRIIELLEQGTVPWKKPWSDGCIPMNLVSKRAYRGINLLMLSCLHYERSLFLTFDQLKKVGGSVKKGEHGHVVVFWKTQQKDQTLEDAETENKRKNRTILQYYKVWNIDQCNDIPSKLVPPFSTQQFDPIMECESIVHKMPECPEIKFKEQRAYYSPLGDFINMPKKKTFSSPESYYSTLFHELVHSTGHQKRLDRKSIFDMQEDGGDEYSFEELIAELGSCFLQNHTGILEKGIAASTAYLEGWLGAFNSNKRMIVFAAAHAQRATDYILNIKEYDRDREVEQSEVLP